MTIPFSTFEGTLKQVTPECLTDQGKILVRVCAPLFLPLTDEQRQDVIESARPDLDPRVKHFYVPSRRYRRFSGDHFADDNRHGLSAGNYYSVCADESGLDFGTLVAEMNAYRSTDARFSCMFIDCLDPATRRLGIPPSPQPLVLITEPAELLKALPRDAPGELVATIQDSVAQRMPFGMVLGIRVVTQNRIEGVLDLRERTAQEWFFERYVPQGLVPTDANRFLDILPELLQPPLGGSTGSNVRLQSVGADLRKLGLNGLIYPSARADVAVEYQDGRVSKSKGWNLVVYHGAPEPRDVVSVDVGGWETRFWGGVRLEERKDETIDGWYVVGLEPLQQLRYEQTMKKKGLITPTS